jgi:hypothetical protein
MYFIVHLIVTKSTNTFYRGILIQCIFCMFRHLGGPLSRSILPLYSGPERRGSTWIECVGKQVVEKKILAKERK